MAWLGWDVPLPILLGALRDQIRQVSQIRVGLTVEGPGKSDGLGTPIGRRIPYAEVPHWDFKAHKIC